MSMHVSAGGAATQHGNRLRWSSLERSKGALKLTALDFETVNKDADNDSTSTAQTEESASTVSTTTTTKKKKNRLRGSHRSSTRSSTASRSSTTTRGSLFKSLRGSRHNKQPHHHDDDSHPTELSPHESSNSSTTSSLAEEEEGDFSLSSSLQESTIQEDEAYVFERPSALGKNLLAYDVNNHVHEEKDEEAVLEEGRDDHYEPTSNSRSSAHHHHEHDVIRLSGSKENEIEVQQVVDDDEPFYLPPDPAAQALLRELGAQELLLKMLDSKSCNRPCIQETKALTELFNDFPSICKQKLPWSSAMVGQPKKLSEEPQTQLLYPLSMLLRLQPSLELVQMVYEAFPEALKQVQTTGDGEYGDMKPLHVACLTQAPLEVIEFLHAQDPTAISTPTPQYGWYPLHFALYFYDKQLDLHDDNDDEDLSESGAQDEVNAIISPSSRKAKSAVVNFLLDQFPQAAQTLDAFGKYPLHEAVRCGVPIAIVTRLHKLLPKAAVTPDLSLRTPLHWACRSNNFMYNEANANKRAVLWFLLRVAPKALTMSARDGWTPIAFCAACQPPRVLKLLLENHPQLPKEALKERDADAPIVPIDPSTPLVMVDQPTLLHVAARSNTSAESVQLIIETFPWMLSAVTKENNETPLHWACFRNGDGDDHEEGGPLEVIQMLIRYNRRMLTVSNHQGQLPLHVARQFAAPSSVLLNASLSESEETGLTSPDTDSSSGSLSDTAVVGLLTLETIRGVE